MKKFFSILVVGMMVGLLFPMMVGAAGKPKISVKVDRNAVCKDIDEETCEWTYSLKVVSDQEITFESIPIRITYAPKDGKKNGAVSITPNAPAESWLSTPSQEENGYLITYYPASGSVTGKEFDLGTLTVKTQKGEEYDCTLNIGFGSVDIDVEIIEENPKTGVTLPITIIALGIVTAVGIYVISKKNTKLYKI